MKRHLFFIVFFVFLFIQTAECKEYNKMFLFEYKILRASEISTLFEEKGNDVVLKTKNDDTFYIFGSVKLSPEANFPSAMVEIKLFDSKRKSLNCTYKLGWVGSANATFFLIKLWDSQTIPEIKYNFDILMRK
jgi:hypothetical protein